MLALRGFHVSAGKHRIVCTHDPLAFGPDSRHPAAVESLCSQGRSARHLLHPLVDHLGGKPSADLGVARLYCGTVASNLCALPAILVPGAPAITL
jgi:hypothetical protein